LDVWPCSSTNLIILQAKLDFPMGQAEQIQRYEVSIEPINQSNLILTFHMTSLPIFFSWSANINFKILGLNGFFMLKI